jgi:hypothetical protein
MVRQIRTPVADNTAIKVAERANAPGISRAIVALPDDIALAYRLLHRHGPNY